MTTHEVLVKARNLIADERNWVQGDFCRNGRRCAAGAVYAVLGCPTGEDIPHDWYRHDAIRALDSTIDEGAGEVVTFNDTHSHADVLAAFDKAITATAPNPDTSFLAEVEEAIPA